MTLLNYSFSQDNDVVYIRELHRVTAAGAAATTMAANALTAVGVSIGATKFASTVKCYARTAEQHEAQTWDVTLSYRTEQFDDKIQNSASGTIIDKGFSAGVENVLRDRSATGSLWEIGAASQEYKKTAQISEPRIEAWWERVHDSFPTTAVFDLLGAVNNATWNGATAGSWLCNDINTRTVRTDSGDRYLARYTFMYKPEKWVLPITEYVWNSRTLSSITAVTKVTDQFDVYRDANFATYGFSL